MDLKDKFVGFLRDNNLQFKFKEKVLKSRDIDPYLDQYRPEYWFNEMANVIYSEGHKALSEELNCQWKIILKVRKIHVFIGKSIWFLLLMSIFVLICIN